MDAFKIPAKKINKHKKLFIETFESMEKYLDYVEKTELEEILKDFKEKCKLEEEMK